MLKKGNETGNGRRHGYLRSWVMTNSEGKFRFTTIRPGSYPNSQTPAHIHMSAMPKGAEEYYIDTILFKDDPYLSDKDYKNNNVLTLTKNVDGAWVGEQVILLKN